MRYEKAIPQDPEKTLWTSDKERGVREFSYDARVRGYREALPSGPGRFISWEDLLEMGPLYDTPSQLTVIELRLSDSNEEGTYLVDSTDLTRRERSRVLRAVGDFLDMDIVSTHYRS